MIYLFFLFGFILHHDGGFTIMCTGSSVWATKNPGADVLSYICTGSKRGEGHRVYLPVSVGPLMLLVKNHTALVMFDRPVPDFIMPPCGCSSQGGSPFVPSERKKNRDIKKPR